MTVMGMAFTSCVHDDEEISCKDCEKVAVAVNVVNTEGQPMSRAVGYTTWGSGTYETDQKPSVGAEASSGYKITKFVCDTENSGRTLNWSGKENRVEDFANGARGNHVYTVTVEKDAEEITYNYTLLYDSPEGGGSLYANVIDAYGDPIYGDWLDSYYSELNYTLKAGEKLELTEEERAEDQGLDFLGWFEGSTLLSDALSYTIDPTTNPNRNRTITGRYGTPSGPAPQPSTKKVFYVNVAAYGPGAEVKVYKNGVYVDSAYGSETLRCEYTGSASYTFKAYPGADNGRFSDWYSYINGVHTILGRNSTLEVQNPVDGRYYTANFENGDEPW